MIDKLRARLGDADIHIGGAEGETQPLLRISEMTNCRRPKEMSRAFEACGYMAIIGIDDGEVFTTSFRIVASLRSYPETGFE
jgi:hypothetical protein